MPKITIEFNSSEPNEVTMAQECLRVVQSWTRPDAEVEVEALTQAEAEVEVEALTQAEVEALAQAGAEARAKAKVEVEALTQAEVEVLALTLTQAEVEALALAQAGAEARAKAKAQAGAEDAPRTVEPIITPKPQATEEAKVSTVAEPTTESKPQVAETSSKPSRKSKKPTFEDFRTAVKAAKEEYGADFCIQVVTSKGAPKLSTLLKTIGEVPKGDYQELMDMLAAGLSPEADEDEAFEETKADPGSLFAEDMDDGLGEEDTAKHVDPAAVKAALKAYARDHSRDEARQIMIDGGAKVLGDVDNLTQKQLTSILKGLA